MNFQENCGKMLTVEKGYLVCPTCQERHRQYPSWRVNKKLLPINPDTTASRLPVYCRDCKTRHIVNIEQGRCFESRDQ